MDMSELRATQPTGLGMELAVLVSVLTLVTAASSVVALALAAL
jgi:hypothetical protein